MMDCINKFFGRWSRQTVYQPAIDLSRVHLFSIRHTTVVSIVHIQTIGGIEILCSVYTIVKSHNQSLQTYNSTRLLYVIVFVQLYPQDNINSCCSLLFFKTRNVSHLRIFLRPYLFLVGGGVGTEWSRKSRLENYFHLRLNHDHIWCSGGKY